MEGSIDLCKTLLQSLEKLADNTVSNLTQAQKIRLLLPSKKDTTPLAHLKGDLEALCLKFYTLDALEQECLGSLMQALETTPVVTTRKRKIQSIQRFQDEEYEEYDSDDDIDLFDDDDEQVGADLQELEDCKLFLDWKDLNTPNAQEHWWFKRRYGSVLNAIQQQMGHEGRNTDAKRMWCIVIEECLAGRKIKVSSAYNKLVTTCVFCDTKHACSKALVIEAKREMIGSHCALLASALIDFFTIVRKGTLENPRQTFKDMEEAFANVQAAHAAKAGN